MLWDIIIVGGGPAGLSAALYASRAGYEALVLEGAFAGGQAGLTSHIDNYPAFAKGIAGAELAESLAEHAKRFGAKVKNAKALSLGLQGGEKRVKTRKEELSCRALVLCMGATPRKLGIPGEAKLTGLGVSYCATCDGAFFKGKRVLVVGGGETAAHDALYLAQLGCDVHLVHRRDELRAVRAMKEKLESTPAVTLHWNTIPLEFIGDDTLSAVKLQDVKSNETCVLPVSGAFVAVGTAPQSEIAEGLERTANGEIITDMRMRTNVPGVFAAGDVRATPFRQVITAAADGAVAANEAIAYLTSL